MIGRAAGTRSSTGLAGVRTTWGDSSSGSQRAIGSSSATTPSSTRSITAAAVIGLVIEATRKIESGPTSPTLATSTLVAAADERGGAGDPGALEEVVQLAHLR